MQQQASTSSETELAESKHRKSEYDKRYRLKLKMEIQQQASTSSETEPASGRRI